ncbi:MAG: type I restriction enzyme HsdR N-terminal domain-containing protein [Bacteroidales bacterium]|nr:type I restriction enzyme HsdR N-terminal domain-containing protein [Bacteroidales bacterium]MBN2757511.1 type I restriction enzyme HsdR N-terminal domain-containing protein [Bacteroidales bacterium]
MSDLKNKYPINIIIKSGVKFIFDNIRKKYVKLTPEEYVRQNFIKYLIEEKRFSPNLIGIEKKLPAKNNFFRTDIVIYDRNAKPLIIVECKAENVKINQDVFEQIAKYNMVFNVDLLIVTNGKQNYICKIDYLTKSYSFLKEIPSFSELE